MAHKAARGQMGLKQQSEKEATRDERHATGKAGKKGGDRRGGGLKLQEIHFLRSPHDQKG